MTSLVIPIAAGADDGSYGGAYPYSFDAASGYTTVGDIAGSNWYTWLRFVGVNIPKGALITNAHLQFVPETSFAWASGTNHVDIQAVAEDDYAAPTDVASASYDRAHLTTGKGQWYAGGALTAGTAYSTADFHFAIQEIVDRAGWVSGNDLGLFLLPSMSVSSYLQIASYEHATYAPVELHVEYIEATPNPLKLYTDNLEPDPFTPASAHGAWDYSTTPHEVMLALAPTGEYGGGSGIGGFGTDYAHSGVADHDVLIWRAAYRLRYDTYFSGNAQGVLAMYEAAADANAALHIHAYALQGETDTVRGTMLDNLIDADELSTAYNACGEAFSSAMANVPAFAGDMVVIEVGFRSNAVADRDVKAGVYGRGASDLADNGDPTGGDPGWIQFDVAAPVAPDNPTLTAPNGGESWREGSTHNLTTAAVPSQSQGYACAFEYEFSAAGDFTDAVGIINAITAASYAWLLPFSLVAANTVTCKVRVRAYVIGSPAVVSSWDASNAVFTVGNSTAPTVTLVTPVDAGLLEGIPPMFIFGTADAEGDDVHVELEVASDAGFVNLYFSTDSATDYADWEQSPSPYTAWSTMPAGGATAGNRIAYQALVAIPFGTSHGRVKLTDAYSAETWITFTFTLTLDASRNLVVCIDGIEYLVTGCKVVEATNGDPSPINLEIDIDQYLELQPDEGDLISITTALGGWDRVWNGTVEFCEYQDSAAKVNIYGVQFDAYLSRKPAEADETIDDIGQNFKDLIDAWGSPLTGTAVDTATGVDAALAVTDLSLAQILTDPILIALPSYLCWVDPGKDVHFVDTADFAAPTYQVYEPDPATMLPPAAGGCTQLPIKTGSSVKRSILESANRVRVRVKGTSIVGEAINTTVHPTYAESPRVMTLVIDSGDQAYADAVAAAQLAVAQETRVYLANIPLDAADGLAIERGQNLQVVRPAFGVNVTSAVRRTEHDLVGCTSLIDIGDFWAVRDDEDLIVAIADQVDRLKKRSA